MKKNYPVFIFNLLVALFLITPPVHAAELLIDAGKKVTMHYTLSVDGQTLDTTFGGTPFEFTFGAEEIVPGLENQIRGLKAGDKGQFIVEPEDAFGAIEQERIVTVPRDQMPENEDVQPGMVFAIPVQDGHELNALVREVNDDHIVLDFNHPLAGKEITFDVEIVNVSD